jgi:dTDP-4-amino-4,6-dideoxygalactose transaminase
MKGDLRSRWPVFEEDEIDAVAAVLRSGRINALHHGEKCAEFETEFARLCSMPYAISLSNGTVALELALRALGVGSGDEVIVPARSFFASASCVIAVGATPVFADVDLSSQCIDPASVRKLINNRTRAVIAVHLAGWPCELAQLRETCEQHSLFMVEDCAQSHGATYDGAPVGSFGDASAFSFCTDKIISTGGEGGMLLFKKGAPFEKAWSFKDHGKNREKAHGKDVLAGRFQWLHDSFGTNMRLTEMQAAIGVLQLRKLDTRLTARRTNANILKSELNDVPGLIIDQPPSNAEHAYYKFYVRLDEDCYDLPCDRDLIAAEVCAQGPICGSGSCPEIYLEKAFQSTGFGPAKGLPGAQRLARSTLMLQCDHTLSIAQMREIGRVTADVIRWQGTKRAAA